MSMEQPTRGKNSPICLDSVSLAYQRKTVVSDVSLHISKGCITALIGPNGCGKSTLLKAMSRIIKPQHGLVSLNGKDINGLPTRQIAQQVALLPQGPISPEGLTVGELVAQGRFPHQSAFRSWSQADQDAVESAIDATAIAELVERPLSSLSGGQRQRCWIAMVLAQDTPIILLDEPTTFLDLKVQIDLMTLLRRVVEDQGRTLVVVLHELNLAAAFADHLVMMKDGRIALEGTPEAIIGPKELAHVFDLRADVIPDPLTGRPICLPRETAPADGV